MSPSEGSPSGGELSGAVLHPSGDPERLSGVAAVSGGKPVRSEESQRNRGIREGASPSVPPTPCLPVPNRFSSASPQYMERFTATKKKFA